MVRGFLTLAVDCGLLTDLRVIEKLFSKLAKIEDGFGYDIEGGYDGPPMPGYSLHPETAVLAGVSVSGDPRWARYVPVRFRGGQGVDEIEFARLLAVLLGSGKGIAHNCFTGDTELLTSDGLRTLGDLVNSKVEVITAHGPVKADVASYGLAEVFEIEFAPARRSRSTVRHFVRATANHRWEMEDGSIVTTDKLMSTYRPPTRNCRKMVRANFGWITPDTYSEAFRHGLIFADGSLQSSQPKHGQSFRHQIRLCGWKAEFVDRFDGVSWYAADNNDPWCTHTSIVNMKSLPPDDADCQYISDFIEGWQLLDGTPHRTSSNTRIVSTVDETTALWLKRNAVRAGWVVSGFSRFWVKSGFTDEYKWDYRITLSKASDLAWSVRSVRSVGVEEVFCPIVPGVERFTLAGGIYTCNSKFELTHLAKFLRDRLSTSELAEAGLEKYGYFPIFSDSMIEAYLCGTYRALGLKYLSNLEFGAQQAEIFDLFPPMTEKMKKCIRFTDLELTPQVVSYACEDAAYCLALSHLNRPKVKDKLLYRVEMGIVPILARMEDHGVQFDWAAMERVKSEAEKFAALMRQEIMSCLSQMTGKPVDINLNSSAQVADVLYTQLGMTTTRLTKSNKMSTDEKALSGLAKKHAVVKRLLEYREVKKLIGSYLEKFPREFRYATDGRSHPSHRQTSIVSGRFAVSDPPYQQLPKKYYYQLESGLEFFLKFRDFIVSAPDHYLIGFDYSQIELRVLAGLSGEPALVRAFEEDVDVHAMTASLMFNVIFSEVSEDQRSMAKTQNFALLYQQGAKGVAERLGISVEEAQAFMDKYFEIFSSVKSWIDKQTKTGVQAGYTVSKFGRIHPLWQLESDSAAIRSTGERLCVNAPVQGGAADLMKIAMVRADKSLRDAGLIDKVHLQMNIHDALVWEAHRSVSPQRIIDLVNPQVCIAIPGWPRIRADWEIGTRWGSMKKIKLDDNNKIIVPQRKPAEESQLVTVG